MGDISLKGYHGTCSFAMKSIESRGFDPDATSPRSDHWLGKGVYFFEDIAPAKWWATDISSKKYGSLPIVYLADIVADKEQVLNLDNNDELASFREFITENIDTIREMCKNENKGYPVFDGRKFRGVFFDYYKRVYGIKVIIATFTKDFVRYVPNYPLSEDEREFQRELSRILGIRFKEKQICVSDQNCIKCFRVVSIREEAEVI